MTTFGNNYKQKSSPHAIRKTDKRLSKALASVNKLVDCEKIDF